MIEMVSLLETCHLDFVAAFPVDLESVGRLPGHFPEGLLVFEMFLLRWEAILQAGQLNPRNE
jgi:hypothetical protein